MDLPDAEEDNKKDTSKNEDDEKQDDKHDSPSDPDSAVMDKAKEMLNFLDSSKDESKKRKREDDDEEEGKNDEDDKEKSDVKDTDMEEKVEKKETEDYDAKHEEEEVKKEKSEDGDEEDNSNKPKALHKTSSIFLRNLPPTVTKIEVEAMCKRYDGFLRSAIADPAPDRRWFRRGWVTFKREVKIKDICYNLNNIRLRDCELGPIVNRDLTKRIRTVPGLTQDKKVVRNDIKLAAKIITNLDNKWGLWKIETDNKDDITIRTILNRIFSEKWIQLFFSS